MRVLITGGAGFIGTNLVRRLVAEGHEVTVLDSLLEQVHGEDSSLLASIDGLAEVVVASITDRAALERTVPGHDAIVHYAAETGTGQSMYEIARYTDVNVGGTGLLLDVLANSAHLVRKLVVASSRSIYGEGKYLDAAGNAVYPSHRSEADMKAGFFELRGAGGGELSLAPTDEASLLHPSSVYGITKQMQEALVMTVAPTLGIAPVALRYQNVYGPGQSLKNPYTGILSIFSTLILRGQPINIFEDGLESRDFVFIDDVVEATYRSIVSDAADGEVFNVGSGVATTVAEVAAELQRALGRSVPVAVSGSFRLGDIRHNIADLAKIRGALGFEPAVSFAEGLARFAAWVLASAGENAPDAGAYERSLTELRERGMLK